MDKFMEGKTLVLHHTEEEIASLLHALNICDTISADKKDLAILVLSCIIEDKLDRLVSLLREYT